MIVHRLLDALFRTLDTIDLARERLERAVGRDRQPQPWTTTWEPKAAAEQQPEALRLAAARKAPFATAGAARKPPPAARKASPQPQRTARPSGKASRKGSIDRTGADLESERARRIVERLTADDGDVLGEEASIDGKRLLARVLWALATAERYGENDGLTAIDISALLHQAAGLEVFSTNVARTCRDEGAWIAEAGSDGRSKRYRLTDHGRARATEVTAHAAS